MVGGVGVWAWGYGFTHGFYFLIRVRCAVRQGLEFSKGSPAYGLGFPGQGLLFAFGRKGLACARFHFRSTGFGV